MRTIEQELDEAAEKAIASLAKYKFMMFGYWAGVWVHLNRMLPERRSNPFLRLVQCARAIEASTKGGAR